MLHRFVIFRNLRDVDKKICEVGHQEAERQRVLISRYIVAEELENCPCHEAESPRISEVAGGWNGYWIAVEPFVPWEPRGYESE